MSGTKWVYITNNISNASRWVYITNDPSKGESVRITNNLNNADEWVYVTNNPGNGDWVYVTNPGDLPSDVGSFHAARGNSASGCGGCGCILLLVIVILLSVLYSYGDSFFSDTFSSINSTITPSQNSSRVERTLTPTPVAEISQLCPTWKTVRKDLSGSRYDIWLQFVSIQPHAMEWSDFKENSIVCNPVLIEDGFVFIKGKEYLLP